ncbi:MAG: NADH-quinone oxidoreductase subunit NuoF [Deltaproteobacteria bacterium CG11_big_fil_rev_8_21_14_0_20_49_13]|nr:MAG: NADH-quinone oxidoreductase subunit NuoF [Deltaproteobacteria bacterium CG11_big_fil_rev_8_21_14_0_20_49_13]
MTEHAKELDRIIEKRGKTPSATIPTLQDIQNKYRYLPLDDLRYVSEKTGISATGLYGVATFYAQFRLSPVGQHIIKVCHGTACHVAGAVGISESLSEHLDAPEGGTTEDNMFTLESVACLGCCSLAPVIMIDETTYGGLNRTKAPRAVDTHRKNCECGGKKDYLEGVEWKRGQETEIAEVVIGLGSCGIASGAGDVHKLFEAAKKEYKLPIKVTIAGCMGLCHREPLIELKDRKGTAYLYGNIELFKAKKLLLDHIGANQPHSEWLLNVDNKESSEGKYFSKQKRIVLENCGKIDPESIDDYIKAGGYTAIKKAFEMGPEAIINDVTLSGLRGRGGGGFSTGLKWKFARAAKGDQKYIICNADEGDPGAFMDRSVLESDPHRVLEGMIIAGLAIGATEGYIYCRAEYPLAVRRLYKAIDEAEKKNLLGNNILGKGYFLNIHIKEGAGAFVCGEETALIGSIEGNRGMPRIRPPFPAISGLWGKPTNINNVETFANIPWIINNGGGAFAAMGTEKSKGSKVFALAGKIKRGGLVEVPMGITLREIINDVGGGTSSGKPVKAVQMGGPSGGCIPESLMNTPVDYDEITKTGAIMGSGGMVVMDEETCMVDVARFFLDFTQKESCGKCTFCRIGTKRMLETLDRICKGEGFESDIQMLEELARQIKTTSLCGLGQTAPNPVLTTLRYFRHEYEAHIRNKKCPAGVCRDLIEFAILVEKCTGCGACVRACPVKAIAGEKRKPHTLDKKLCTHCGACKETCKFEAILVS